MADKNQLETLKNGVPEWNAWRRKYPKATVDLTGSDLNHSNLDGANLESVNLKNSDLHGANLRGTNFRMANLSQVNLMGANLREAILTSSDLADANLSVTRFDGAKLNEADLKGAKLEKAILEGTDLREANLQFSELNGADFSGANLKGANLEGAILGGTVFGDNDLSKTKGLSATFHMGVSIVDALTLKLSTGMIPEKFLRGCGLSDWEIESAKLHRSGLSKGEEENILKRIQDLRTRQAVQVTPLFISYHRKDEVFVDVIGRNLDERGTRYWRAVHDDPGRKLEEAVDRSLRQNPIVLMILSTASVKTKWVEEEVKMLREVELRQNRDILYPITVDGAGKDHPWAGTMQDLITKTPVWDFSQWREEGEFSRKFKELMRGLKLYSQE